MFPKDGQKLSPTLNHRGLKLDGAIGQGEICIPSKVKIFQNPDPDST